MKAVLLRQAIPRKRFSDFNSPSQNLPQVSGQAVASPLKSVTVLSSIQESAQTEPTPFIGADWARGRADKTRIQAAYPAKVAPSF